MTKIFLFPESCLSDIDHKTGVSFTVSMDLVFLSFSPSAETSTLPPPLPPPPTTTTSTTMILVEERSEEKMERSVIASSLTLINLCVSMLSIALISKKSVFDLCTCILGAA